jgi:uncharacterized protein (DUF488 family)
MGRIGCPETSVRYYHSTLRKNPKTAQISHRGGSLKSRTENADFSIFALLVKYGAFRNVLRDYKIYNKKTKWNCSQAQEN